IFDLYGVEDEIQRALERKVPLKSGGYLVVDPAEAMTTIDINTGAFVGHRNLHDTIFNTNIEATQAIARQLRLRNLGGIIIIDVID
ncbi:ribonuclease E/G, partial [Mycobacterium tuberculosis]|nr:ribonuclease E/G [Mycobacterium tuberculosis]